ncbi:BrnT family toxin [Methylobacterium sp. NEAU 140]|uniref:BrnT family toxin n=1 Tax=Methylobacterium sp. NEAU 140 TaxID=3064945 RepID=UPI00273359D2|nr:BrnT family toxin [Methylobacterium sp. NEAU 140]MDP4023117.1 BrnT family toxin [Methylobacterium sp. NEAU 140]
MNFDWDPGKEGRVLAERGFGFGTAALIFRDRVVTWQDTRRDYGELRMIAVGRTDGRFYTLVYTDRGDTRWIITAWPSNRKERARWHASA